jgi:hypothetical protein
MREEAAAAEEAARFLEQVFRVTDPSESRGNAVTARELLDRSVADIANSLADQPRLRGRLLERALALREVHCSDQVDKIEEVRELLAQLDPASIKG